MSPTSWVLSPLEYCTGAGYHCVCGWYIWCKWYNTVLFSFWKIDLRYLPWWKGSKEGVVCVKPSLSKGQNLLFIQANVSSWLTQANPRSHSPGLHPRHLTLLVVPCEHWSLGFTTSLRSWWWIVGTSLSSVCRIPSWLLTLKTYRMSALLTPVADYIGWIS